MISGESHARNRYSYFASQANKEGYEQMAAIFLDISETLCRIAVAETGHERRYLALLKNIEQGTVFKRGEKVVELLILRLIII